MGREPLLKRIAALIKIPCSTLITSGINSRFQELFQTWGQITHAFLTLAPLCHCWHRSTCMPNPCRQRSFWARIKLSKQNYSKPVARSCFVLQDSILSQILSIRFLFTTTLLFFSEPQNHFLGFIALFNFQRASPMSFQHQLLYFQNFVSPIKRNGVLI